MLRMKLKCEQCGCTLYHQAEAYICSYETTYCPECAQLFKDECPECNGELVLRPKRIIPTLALDRNTIA